MSEHIQNVNLGPVEADEIWDYVKKKEGHKKPEEKTKPRLGDAYTLVAPDGAPRPFAGYRLGQPEIDEFDDAHRAAVRKVSVLRLGCVMRSGPR